MTPVAPLRADGERVWVTNATDADVAAYVLANQQSQARIIEWNPVDPFALPGLVRAASRFHRTLLIHSRQRVGEHDIVGKVNVTNVVRGRADYGTLGYDAYDPYAGKGLFAEGLALAVGLAFAPEPAGLGLHRLEVNVQPGNVRSAMVLRQLGFRLEGHSPAYLRMPVPASRGGHDAWRDHDRYALLATEWPPSPLVSRRPPRLVALVNGVPGSGKSTLAPRLATTLGLPLFSKDVVKEAIADQLTRDLVADLDARRSRLGAGASEALWALLAHSSPGGVIESWFWPGDEGHVVRGLTRGGLEPVRVPEIWCDVPLALARERFAARAIRGHRHEVHGPQSELEGLWRDVATGAHPMGLGPVIRVDTSAPVTDREVDRLALRVRAAGLGG